MKKYNRGTNGDRYNKKPKFNSFKPKRDLNTFDKNETKHTGWGQHASWYERTVNQKFSYQKDVILPYLKYSLKGLDLSGKNMLDIGCGNGFFLESLLEVNPKKITAIDIDEALIENAKQLVGGNSKVEFQKVDATKGLKYEPHNFDFIISIESIVNMRDIKLMLKSASEILSKNGEFLVVVNHPAFRVPKSSDWYFDAKIKQQGRVVYKYKSSHEIAIDMHPSVKQKKTYTYTFHRSLEEYINSFGNAGLKISKIKELYSTKSSEFGPKKLAEDMARREIPMFLVFHLKKDI